MTTLPQMSSLRLPRVAQPTQLSVPSQFQMVGAQSASRMTGADVWRVIRANLWLIVVMLIVMGGLGFAANQYLAGHYPRYTATGLIRVETVINYDPVKQAQAT